MIEALQTKIQSQDNGAEILTQTILSEVKNYQATGGTAYISVDSENALNTAKAIDLLHKAGTDLSKIAGLPVTIKDLFDIKGQATYAGSKVLDNSPAQADASSVATLKKAGAVILGRTNMSEFAFSGLGYNPHYGTPTFTDNFTRIAGGSTSGGAVSVALNHAVAALGTDTGGSLRIPAAFCNLVGFKPSTGRIDKDGAYPLSYSFDTIGAITHSVTDTIILDEILSGQPHKKVTLLPSQLNLAITKDYFFDEADDTVRETFDKTILQLKQAGATITEIDLSELYDIPKINISGGLTAAEAWHIHQDNLSNPSKYTLYDVRVAKRIQRGKDISSYDYLAIQHKRQHLINIISHKLSIYDALLYPTVAIVPPLAQPIIEDEDIFFATNALVLRNTTVANMLDGCAISIPCLNTVLPVGLSIMGLHGSDTHILNIASILEAVLLNEKKEIMS